VDEQFRSFKAKYAKQYTAEESVARFEIFKENVRKINEHNGKPGVSYSLGINEYADMTHEEFLKAKLSTEQTFSDSDKFAHQPTLTFPQAPPVSLDYRTNTNPVIVPPVRDATQCTAGIAFSIVDSIAADYAKSSKDDVVIFDIGYVTDCDGQGCGGQTASVVWSYITKYGLTWYYNGCPTAPGVGLCIAGSNCTKSGSEPELQSAVATHGPISVQIDASQASFQLYKSGIYYDAGCSSTKLSHSVLIVGYGSTNGQDYWIARNIWGKSWGQNGDILLARNKNNNCGVATAACYARSIKTCVCSI